MIRPVLISATETEKQASMTVRRETRDKPLRGPPNQNALVYCSRMEKNFGCRVTSHGMFPLLFNAKLRDSWEQLQDQLDPI